MYVFIKDDPTQMRMRDYAGALVRDALKDAAEEVLIRMESGELEESTEIKLLKVRMAVLFGVVQWLEFMHVSQHGLSTSPVDMRALMLNLTDDINKVASKAQEQ